MTEGCSVSRMFFFCFFFSVFSSSPLSLSSFPFLLLHPRSSILSEQFFRCRYIVYSSPPHSPFRASFPPIFSPCPRVLLPHFNPPSWQTRLCKFFYISFFSIAMSSSSLYSFLLVLLVFGAVEMPCNQLSSSTRLGHHGPALRSKKQKNPI